MTQGKNLIGHPRPLFAYFCSFQTQIFRNNCGLQQESNSDCRRKGKHAVHLTSTATAQDTSNSLEHYDLRCRSHEALVSGSVRSIRLHSNGHIIQGQSTYMMLVAAYGVYVIANFIQNQLAARTQVVNVEQHQSL